MLASDQAHGPVVGVGAVVVRDGAVLLIRRGQEPLRGRWSIPGGRVKWGERLEDAVVRETREETGLDVVPREQLAVLDLIESPVAAHGHHFVIVDFLCDLVAGEARAASDAEDVAWASRVALSGFDLPARTLEVVLEGMRRVAHSQARQQ
jgi:ADP-ribose pyrophosphatase